MLWIDYPCHIDTLPGTLFETNGTTPKSGTLPSLLGFRIFELPVRGSFQLSFTVLVCYRTQVVFKVGSWCLPVSPLVSSKGYSRTHQYHSQLPLRDYHTLWSSFPGEFRFPREGIKVVLQHHISLSFQRGIQFAFRCFHSPLLTASYLISFPAGTKMFQFPAFPIITDLNRSLIRVSSVQSLHAARQSISLLVTPFVSSWAKSST